MQDFVLSLIVWISTVTGYAIPDATLTIQPVTHQEISQTECKHLKKDEFCPIVGVYSNNKIVLATSGWYGTEDDIDSFLVHELTHWMQDHSNRYLDRSMQNCLIQELEAYVVQNKYVKDVQKRDKTYHAPHDLCKSLGR